MKFLTREKVGALKTTMVLEFTEDDPSEADFDNSSFSGDGV